MIVEILLELPIDRKMNLILSDLRPLTTLFPSPSPLLFYYYAVWCGHFLRCEEEEGEEGEEGR